MTESEPADRLFCIKAFSRSSDFNRRQESKDNLSDNSEGRRPKSSAFCNILFNIYVPNIIDFSLRLSKVSNQSISLAL